MDPIIFSDLYFPHGTFVCSCSFAYIFKPDNYQMAYLILNIVSACSNMLGCDICYVYNIYTVCVSAFSVCDKYIYRNFTLF